MFDYKKYGMRLRTREEIRRKLEEALAKALAMPYTPSKDFIIPIPK